MSYFDFVIRKEQVLLRNTYSNEDLQKSTNLKNLESFHLAFQKILKIMIFMENHLHNCESYENIYNDELKGFLEENCQAYSNDIRMFIEETKMIEKKKLNYKNSKVCLTDICICLRYYNEISILQF